MMTDTAEHAITASPTRKRPNSLHPPHANDLIDLAVVIPTYNERGNIPELIARLQRVLDGIAWELIFVDDDSPDGTADLIREYAARDRRIRLLHRIGRRGLSSACTEGMLATPAEYIAIMDADLQHDETILPGMLDRLRTENLDVVVGTRNGEGGCMGDLARARIWLSRLGEKLSRLVCPCHVSDPMSGFFVVRRTYFQEVVQQLQDGGFKILVDILASSRRPVRLGEVGYRFRNRTWGQSKLDTNAAIECLFLIANKLLGGRVSSRFAGFVFVGLTGIALHLACLTLFFQIRHQSFAAAQMVAALAAIAVTFFLNNLITYYDRRLRGFLLWSGLLAFCLACSFGVFANLSCAEALLSRVPWYIAGLAGAAVSSIWNYAVSQILTWPRRRPYDAPLRGGSHFFELLEAVPPDPIETLPEGTEEEIVA